MSWDWGFGLCRELRPTSRSVIHQAFIEHGLPAWLGPRECSRNKKSPALVN